MKTDKTTLAVVGLAGVGLFLLYRWNNKGTTAAAPAFSLGNTPMPTGSSSGGGGLGAIIAALAGSKGGGSKVVDNGTAAPKPAPAPAPSAGSWGAAAPAPNPAPAPAPSGGGSFTYMYQYADGTTGTSAYKRDAAGNLLFKPDGSLLEEGRYISGIPSNFVGLSAPFSGAPSGGASFGGGR